MQANKNGNNDFTLRANFDFFRLHKLTLADKSTVYQYDLNLRRFDEFLGRPALVSDLQDQVVLAAIVWLTRQKKLSPATASKFRDNICCLWRFLSRKRIVDTDPDVPEVKEPRRVPIALTRDQLKRIWEFLQRMPGTVAGIPCADWFCSLVATLWDTGARKGEMLGLRSCNVDLAGGFIVAKAETVKGGREDRLYRIRPSTVELIARIYDPGREFVWPWPWSDRVFYSRLSEVMVKNGLPDDRHHKTHIFRKSVATHLLVEGGNPQQALGHSTFQMTQRYIDPKIAMPPSPIDRLWEIGK